MAASKDTSYKRQTQGYELLTGSDQEEKTHDFVLRQTGGYSWLALRATFILIPAKVSGDLIVNIAAFY